VVQHLARLALVELEVTVTEVDEPHACHEDEQPRVVRLAIGLERVVAQLVAIGFVVHVVFLFERVAVRVGREDVRVAAKLIKDAYLDRGRSLWCL